MVGFWVCVVKGAYAAEPILDLRRIKSTPIPYFSWLLIDISGHENIFL